MCAMIRLYHFTSRYHLPSIFSEGLTRGDVPLSPDTQTQAVNLTSEGRFNKQHYNATSKFFHMGAFHPLDKTEVRITVDVDSSHRLLVPWIDLVSRYGTDKAWLQHLHRGGKTDGKEWFLFFGRIPPEDFASVEFNSNGNGAWRKIDSPLSIAPVQDVRFTTSSKVEGYTIKSIPQDIFVATYLSPP